MHLTCSASHLSVPPLGPTSLTLSRMLSIGFHGSMHLLSYLRVYLSHSKPLGIKSVCQNVSAYNEGDFAFTPHGTRQTSGANVCLQHEGQAMQKCQLCFTQYVKHIICIYLHTHTPSVRGDGLHGFHDILKVFTFFVLKIFFGLF